MSIQHLPFPRRTYLVSFLSGLMICLCGTELFASEPANTPDQGTAERLFHEGRALMDEMRYTEACLKFAKSYNLDASGGTILHLATCHQAEGKGLIAWTEFNEAIRFARLDNRKDREVAAQRRLDELAKDFPKISIELEGLAANLPDLDLTIDGISIPREQWSAGVPIEPGRHIVVASSKDRIPSRRPIEVGKGVSSIAVRFSELRPSLAVMFDFDGRAPGTSDRSAPNGAAGSEPASHLKSLPRGPAPDTTSASATSSSPNAKGIAGIALVAVGSVGLGIGVGLTAHTIKGSGEHLPYSMSCLVLGGVSAIGGITLLSWARTSQNAGAAAAPRRAYMRAGPQSISIIGEF